MKEISNGLKAVAQRMVNAKANFVANVQERIGCTEAEALKILALYREYKLVKADAVNGTLNLVCGDFWDAEVLRRALEKAS